MNKRIFNEQKTQELSNPDLSLGYLREDKLLVRTEPAQTAIQEQGHYEPVQEYPNGGKDVKWVIDVPGVQAREAQNIYEDIKLYIPFTADQIEQQKKARRTQYLDAYRKYQAAVNYGEYSRVPEVDVFISRLFNKDWAAWENVPPAIKYFIGECAFEQSGLIKNTI